MHDEADDVRGFNRPTWRRVIRCPTVRRDAALNIRRSTSRHWARLWARAALAPDMRPARD
jgi:hypothetical protein